MVLERLSPSRASDFKQCPQLYRFRSVDKLDEPTTVHQARGTTAHSALERLFDLPMSERTPEQLHHLFRRAWTEARNEPVHVDLFPDVESERRWGLESLGLLSNYFSVEDPATFEPLGRELDLVEDVGDMTIRGILDRIDRNDDGGLVITDYKTGRAPSERASLPAFFALKIYALLIRKRMGETPTELRLLYLNGPTVYRLAIDDRQLDGIETQLRALWAAIERAIDTDHFPAKPGWMCSWCSFSEMCPAKSLDGVERRKAG